MDTSLTYMAKIDQETVTVCFCLPRVKQINAVNYVGKQIVLCLLYTRPKHKPPECTLRPFKRLLSRFNNSCLTKGKNIVV